MKLQLRVQGDSLIPHTTEAADYIESIAPNAILSAEIKHLSKKDHRSLDQNRMQHRWYRDLAKQGDLTALEYRSYCKAHFGVPLLCLHDEAFREQYNDCIRPLPYEQKLSLMGGVIDLPITSRMSVQIMAQYLKAMSDFWLEKGMQLTTFEHLFEWIKEDNK